MMPATPGISLCMIVRNEEQHLERCLLSVQGIVSEMIIADTGSTDSSMDIARRFGARVIRLPWKHDFAKARNATLERASCPWILVLDADEAIADWDAEEVAALLEAPGACGFFLPFIHYVGEAPGGEYVTDNVCRLFRRDERIRFRGSIHEEAATSIWSLPDGHVAYAALPVHHYGYLDAELQRKNKTARNLELIISALKLEPDSIPLRYALGTEYYQQGSYGSAAEIMLPLLAEVPADSGYTADLYLKTAYALEAGGQPEAARAVYEAGSSLFADFTDLLESYAGLLLNEGDIRQAYHLLQRALQSGNTAHKYPSSSGSGSSRTRLSAGQVCERLLLFDEALEHYGQAVCSRPDDPAAWEQLAALCLLSGQQEQLTAFTRQLLHALPGGVLSRLVPAALNARAAPWLAALGAAPHLPEDVRQVVQVLLDTLFRDPEQPQAASVRLERMLPEAPDPLWRSGYLWALSCRCGGSPSGPGLNTVLPPGVPDLAYAAQLLVQTGAWDTVLQIFSAVESPRFRWSRLPQPLLHGLLHAPAPFRLQWCAMYAAQEHSYSLPGDAAEWLLYAALADSCGRVPRLSPADELALRQSGGPAAAIGLSYYNLLLAAEVQPQGVPRVTGSIPWLLLARSALQAGH